MKRFKALSLVLALVLVLSATFTGCSSKNSDPTTTGTDTQGTTTPGATDTLKETVTLTFYGFSDWVDADPYKEVYQAAKAQFEKENPGYVIELQSDPWGDWATKIKTKFAAGQQADISFVNNPDFPTFANSNSLLNLDSYVQAGYFDDFFPGVLSMYKWKGQTMAIPFTTDTRILWYNKKLFEEAGLDPNTPPATWEELVKAANTITEKTGKYGFGMDLGLQEFPTQGLFCASNGSILNVDNSGKITPNVNTEEFKTYLKTLAGLKPTFEPDYTTLNQLDVSGQFAQGQFGMIIGNTLVETDIYDKDWYGQALVPKMNASAPNGSFGGGFGICVSAKTKAPEQAVKFAQMLCSKAYNAKLISDIPANNASLGECSFAKDPKFGVYMDQIKYARQAQPKTLFYAAIDKAVYDTVTEVVVGGKDIDASVTKLEESINKIISK